MNTQYILFMLNPSKSKSILSLKSNEFPISQPGLYPWKMQITDEWWDLVCVYCFAVSDFLARTVVINNASECSCCEIACCCEYISSLPAGAAVKVQALLITPKRVKEDRREDPSWQYLSRKPSESRHYVMFRNSTVHLFSGWMCQVLFPLL